MNYRISEDYNYKSTLASSYEGFRSEAIRIDPYLEAKLFIIAMERLDEIPLRFVDPEVKNSPLHDLISSKEFNDVIENSDELKLRVISIIKNLKDVPKDMLEYIESLKK